ncbi:MAG: alpha/beta fold hydrolase [Chloroflexi bacterium]|nr:alpha/beta fold hydrolase [Chloroflexota bacterium]
MRIDLELYRRDIVVSQDPPVRLSVIDIDPGPLAQGAMVFVHGFGGQAAQWQAQIRFFADDYRILAPDLRGHGWSDKPASRYSIEELLGDLNGMLAECRVPEKFILFGHSFGGAVAAAYAAQHPERVEKLVLIGTATEFELGLQLRLAQRVPTPVLQFVISRFMRNVFGTAQSLKAYYENALKPWDGRLFREIQTPTLVIRGHRDFVFPQAAYGKVAQLVPGAQEVIVPVSAHLVHLERADATNRAIQRFLGPVSAAWRQQRESARAQLVRERPWLKSYEPEVPHTIIAPSQPLHRFLASAARRFGSRPATIFYGHALSWAEMYALSSRFARVLMARGVQKGDRVILSLPNVPQMVFCYYGVLMVGAVAVPFNPLAGVDEFEHAMASTGAVAVVALSKAHDVVGAAAARTGLRNVILTNLKEHLSPHMRLAFTLTRERREGHRADVRTDEGTRWLNDLLKEQSPTPPDVAVGPDDPALIQYTTGTTNLPKGVLLTHANLVANAIQTRHWYSDARDGRERVLAALPFTHMYGLTACLNLSACLGAAMILLPTFETREVLETIRDQRPTIFPGVPDMYVAINNFPRVRQYRLSSVRACLSGSAPLPVEIAEAFVRLTKGRLVEGYGLTEAGPVTHANPLGGRVKVGSIGIPVPSTEARIVDLNDGHLMQTGEIGELCVRGPQIMRGYWNDPADTAKALDADGWLHTGDVARMDEDGYFQIIDRRANIWYPHEPLFSRRPVFPRDIEEVLYEHPKVREAVVVPVGDEPKAFIILKDGERALADELINFCRGRLDDYLVPRSIEFTRDLPRTYIGKVKRWQLLGGAGRAPGTPPPGKP